MSNVYESRYGASFNGLHSFRNYSLLPTSAPVISAPEVKSYYVDVPGADGSLDLTEVLTGFPTYGDRQGTFEYLIYAPKEEWYNIYNRLVNDLNGKQADVILDEDSQYYYRGRLTVGDPSFGKWKATIKITGIFASDKYVQGSYSGNDWLWDPFDFENGVAREYYKINVRDRKKVTLIGSGLTVCPTFNLESGSLSVVVDGQTHALKQGDNIFLNILLKQEEEKDVVFKGRGVVTITYRIGGVS